MTEIRRFRVESPQADVDDLRDRLRRTRWGAEIPGQGWDRGVPVDYLRGLAAYWADEFDWRAAERRLNELPQFLTEVELEKLRFIAAHTPDSMQAFIRKVLMPALDAKIEQLTH